MKSIVWAVTAALAIFGLCGCIHQAAPPPVGSRSEPAGAGRPNVHVGEPAGAAAPNSRLPVRSVLCPNDSCPGDFGAYGYVLLTQRASANNAKRYELFSAAFIDAFEPVSSGEPASTQMVTFWLLQSPASQGGPLDEKRYISDYDYARAAKIATVIGKYGSRGPVLAAWVRPFEEDGRVKQALVFDLSDFAEEDFERALLVWRDRISRDPTLWRDGWRVELFRQACWNLVQRYGEKIFAVITEKGISH